MHLEHEHDCGHTHDQPRRAINGLLRCLPFAHRAKTAPQ